MPMQTRENFSILLVDDDSMTVRILSRMLNGFAPLRFATSGRAALKLAHESVPDLMLLDVDMPELSGFEVCKAFKSDPTLAEVPIIFVTSYGSAQLEAKGLELGAADFISKPPHAPLVLARVRTYQRLKLLSDTMRSAIKIDFLTGAVTRREFERTLAQECLRAERSAAPLGLLLADIQGFTTYNAEFGEEQGDLLLKAVAEVLRSAARRPTDVLGRYAGGQFALLLPETSAHDAGTIGRRAAEAVNELPIAQRAGVRHARLELAVGCAHRTIDGTIDWKEITFAKPVDLFAAAEQALKTARSTGVYQEVLLNGDVHRAGSPLSAAQ